MSDNDAEKHLQGVRHSLAHLLAAAVIELYPEAKNTIGPAIEDGFYTDFDMPEPISENELPAIEAKMREILKTWTTFERREADVEEGRKVFAWNPYKVEMLEELAAKGEPITIYTSGEFVDLCRGGHVNDAQKEIDPQGFKLTKVSGAYWHADQTKQQLQRIYGVAFESAKALRQHLAMVEEAKKRDHRKIGQELDLFTFSPLVGKGLPLWTERGTTIRRELERFIVDEEISRGYKHVTTPDLASIKLFEKSGHYPYYKDSMYSPIDIDGEQFMLRPMTCPHHFQLYLDKPRTYKDLPMRIAELAKLYRYEQSGELSGLMRVRSFTLADSHIICTPDQAFGEAAAAMDLIEYCATVFGLEKGKDYRYRLSLGDRSDESKYFKDDAAWDNAENILRKLLKDRDEPFYEAEGEAAFYGPKIDVQMKNVLGKEDTAFTVQYDFVMPKRFELTYKDADNNDQEAVVIHRSSIGATERVIAFLIEHTAGKFPTWLAPEQIRIITVNQEDATVACAQDIAEKAKDKGLRVYLDNDNESVGKKIRQAEVLKVPYTLVIGEKEIASGEVTPRIRSDMSVQSGDEAVGIEQFLETVAHEVKSRVTHTSLHG